MASSSENIAAAPRRQLSGLFGTRGTSDIDGRSTTGNLHAVFGFSMAFFGSLVSLKYLGSTDNPFKAQAPIMMPVIFFSFLYLIAVLSEIRNGADHAAVNTTTFFRIVYIVSGSIVVMLLGYILCGPFVLIVMNPATFCLVEVLLVMFKRAMPEVDAAEENSSIILDVSEEVPMQMPAEENPSIILDVFEEVPIQSPDDPETVEMELPV